VSNRGWRYRAANSVAKGNNIRSLKLKIRIRDRDTGSIAPGSPNCDLVDMLLSPPKSRLGYGWHSEMRDVPARSVGRCRDKRRSCQNSRWQAFPRRTGGIAVPPRKPHYCTAGLAPRRDAGSTEGTFSTMRAEIPQSRKHSIAISASSRGSWRTRAPENDFWLSI
jgi:hypothetical protein